MTIIAVLILLVAVALIVRGANAGSSEEERVLTAVYQTDFTLDEPYQHSTNGRKGSKARQGRWASRDN